MQDGDVELLDRTAGAIRGRISRVEHVVTSEMENFEAGDYTDAVYKVTGTMRNRSKILFFLVKGAERCVRF